MMVDAADLLILKLATIGSLTDADKALLHGLPMRVTPARKGTVIAADGEITPRTCLVVSGFMHREKLTAKGARQILSFHIAGDIPDLQSLYLNKMDHSLVATSDCTVALIEHGDLAATLMQSATLTALMWRDSLIDAASFRAWMLVLGQTEADTRMAHLFCEIFVRLRLVGLVRGRSFDFPITQVELSDALGIGAVHANRTLQDLRARGLISVERSRVTILDWPRLTETAGFDPAYLHYADEDAGK